MIAFSMLSITVSGEQPHRRSTARKDQQVATASKTRHAAKQRVATIPYPNGAVIIESLRAPGHFYFDGDFVFDRDGEEARPVDFEVGACGGDGSADLNLVALCRALKLDVPIVRGLTGELDFEIGVDDGRVGGWLG